MSNIEFAGSHSLCRHCGTPNPQGKIFCCAGCASVYEFLHSQGLARFYELNAPLRSIAKPVERQSISENNYSELGVNPEGKLEFYIEGIHCLGCLWVLERLPEITPGIISARLDLGSSVLTVEIDRRTSFPAVAQTIAKLGYRPRALAQATDYGRRESRIALIRIGIAGAATGNIMLLAVSIYGGISGKLADAFALLSGLLALPVLTYAAWPIYRNAILGIRERRISVDLPISLALIAGVLISVISLMQNGTEVYFDSLSMLVFLLLVSRYALDIMRRHSLRSASLLDFINNERFSRIENGEKVEISNEKISVGDILCIATDQSLPCDGELKTFRATLDLSLLTGETEPQELKQGELVYAGAINRGPELQLVCRELGKSTRLGKILQQLDQRVLSTPFSTFADQAARWFMGIVLVIAAALLLFFWQTPAVGIERALALVIVTCPCVLAFAVPLSLARSAQTAARKGIILQNLDALEKIPQIEEIFLDKTGTLTFGDFRVLSCVFDAAVEPQARVAVLSLEASSRHPIARSLVRFLSESSQPLRVQDLKEVPGLGVSGYVLGTQWSISRAPSKTPESTAIFVYRNGALVGKILLADRLRPEAISFVRKLRKYSVHLLSGDNQATAKAIGAQAGIAPENIHAPVSPEKKSEMVLAARKSLMIGDGFNDALALQNAYVGIAMQGGAEASLKHADIFLSRPGLSSVADIFAIAEKNFRVTQMNLFYSASYNLIAGSLAVLGLMTPLWAAVIMPISALTVYFNTMIFIRPRENKS